MRDALLHFGARRELLGEPCRPLNGPVTSLCVDLAGDVDGLAVLGGSELARAVVIARG